MKKESKKASDLEIKNTGGQTADLMEVVNPWTTLSEDCGQEPKNTDTQDFMQSVQEVKQTNLSDQQLEKVIELLALQFDSLQRIDHANFKHSANLSERLDNVTELLTLQVTNIPKVKQDDWQYLVDLIAIRNYTTNAINNFSLNKEKAHQLNKMLTLMDNKIVDGLLGDTFKSYVDFKNVDKAVVDAARNNNIKFGMKG